jgi:hypothetical protein
MNNFFGFQLGGFQLGFSSQRTDHLTRMLPVNSFVNRILGAKDKEQWDTVTNNEYRLYRSTPELFIVINKFATLFSNGIFVVKDYKTGEVIENHPLLKLLEKPNPLMNRNTWLMDIAVSYHVFGTSYNYMNKGSQLSDYPSVLMPLPNAEIITLLTGKMFKASTIDEIIKGYKIDSTKERFETNEVLVVKRLGSDNPTKGISVLEALQMPISNIRGAYGMRNVNIVKRGALGIISPESNSNGTIPLDEHDRNELEKQFVNDTHGIFDNQSPIKFTEKAIKYQQLSYPIKDSMVFEEIDADMMKIIDAVGLNANIFSQKDSPKYENLLQGVKMAYQDAIIPFAEMFCFAMNDAMGLFEKGYYVELDYSHIPAMKEDEKSKAEIVKLKVDSRKVLMESGMSEQNANIVTGIKIE